MAPRVTLERYTPAWDKRLAFDIRNVTDCACATPMCNARQSLHVIHGHPSAYCSDCSYQRSQRARAAAKKAHETMAAKGGPVTAHQWWGTPLPKWLGSDKSRPQTFRVRQGIVLDRTNTPVVIIHAQTLRILQWVTPDILKEWWPKLAKQKGVQLSFGFTDYILSNERVVETGVHPWEASSHAPH